MSPGSVISQLNSMNENLEQAVLNAETMLLNVNDFLDTGDGLKGKSYDSVRNYFGVVHVPVLNVMIQYAKDMIQENNTYKGYISSYLAGVNYIDEDGLKQDKEFLERQINQAYNLMTVSKASVSSYISSLEHAKSLVEKKLKQIEDFMGATAGLYQGLNFSNQGSNQNLMLAINTINNPSIGYAERNITVKLLLGDVSIEEFETMLNEYREGDPEVTYEDIYEYLNELKDNYFITLSDYSSILNKIDSLNHVPSDIGVKYMNDITSLLSERKPLAAELRGELEKVLSINLEDAPSALVEYKLLRCCSNEILEGKVSITEIQEIVDVLQRKDPKIFYNIGILYVHSPSDYNTVINNIIKPYTTVLQYATEDLLHELEWAYVTDEHISEMRVVMVKYDITTPDRIFHFLAQCTIESRISTKDDFTEKENTNTYGGAGRIQITGKDIYYSFAIWVALEQYPELNEIVQHCPPAHNGPDIIQAEYDKLVAYAKENGLNIDESFNIVNEGKNYVGAHYEWESAGYYWKYSDCNDKVDEFTPIDINSTREFSNQDRNNVDAITDIINSGESREKRDNRIAEYEKILIYYGFITDSES